MGDHRAVLRHREHVLLRVLDGLRDRERDLARVGYGKAREVPLAITKAVEDAKKNLFTVPKHGTTITHEMLGQFDAARVLLRPASEGTGVIAGGGVRAVLELGGVRNVLAKWLGTTNPINMAKATVAALQQLRRPEDVARIRGKQISEVLPIPAIRPKAEEAPAPAVAAPVVEDAPAPAEEGPPRRSAPRSRRRRLRRWPSPRLLHPRLPRLSCGAGGCCTRDCRAGG